MTAPCHELTRNTVADLPDKKFQIHICQKFADSVQ